jgi:hypothetical protein
LFERVAFGRYRKKQCIGFAEFAKSGEKHYLDLNFIDLKTPPNPPFLKEW